MRILELWRQWRADAPRRQTQRAINAVRRESLWLAKRPFSNKYDGDSAGGGYFAGAGPQSGGEDEALRKRRNWR